LAEISPEVDPSPTTEGPDTTASSQGTSGSGDRSDIGSVGEASAPPPDQTEGTSGRCQASSSSAEAGSP